MRIFLLSLFFGTVKASMPFENEQYIGFQLLIAYDEKLHICTFKVVLDTQELQHCIPKID